jgi:hypothetical protein
MLPSTSAVATAASVLVLWLASSTWCTAVTAAIRAATTTIQAAGTTAVVTSTEERHLAAIPAHVIAWITVGYDGKVSTIDVVVRVRSTRLSTREGDRFSVVGQSRRRQGNGRDHGLVCKAATQAHGCTSDHLVREDVG